MAAGDPGSPARYYSSIAVETALSGSIPAQAQGAANTAFIVASVSGFPSNYPYTLIVDPDTSKEEVVTVTAGSGTTLSVTRGSDNTQGVAHSAGAVVRHGVSGRDFREAETHIAARGYDIDQTILDLANQTHVHGIVTAEGVVVGTLKAQTLTQKTLTTPIINGATITGTVTATSATFTSPTISGSPVITGLSSAGMVASSATPKDYVDSILGSATSAAISAASAAASATSAATSATSAAASASAAASSASASATSASAAATSAASAAASATAAATSATSAGASATAAATSATASASSASASATSATASASSASAAATSATSAAASATAAATSATSAAASATAANTSAINAAASESAVAASAAAAATSATSASASATAAATSAASASTSASSALTSQTAAATSASSASTSASSALTSATSAATSYDEFDDRYLGAKSSPPSVDNDGNALLTGALYWNTVSNKMFVWSGSAWTEISSSADIISYKYTVAGGATSVTGADDNGLTLAYTVGKEQVYINGVLQVRGSDYTASTGTSITGMAALTASDIVTILAFTAFVVANTYTIAEANATFIPDAIVDTKGDLIVASAADTVARLAAGSNGETLVADSSTSTGLRYQGSIAAGRNFFINGGQDVWQRGTSFSGAQYTSDRWFMTASSGTLAASRSTDVPTSPYFQYALSVTGTSAQNTQIYQRIESANSTLFAGQSVTLSIWAKNSSGTTKLSYVGTYPTAVDNFASSTQDVTGDLTATSWSGSWTKYSVTFTANALATRGYTIILYRNGTETSTTLFTGMQLEVGSVATAFSRVGGTIQGELSACQRYYYRQGGDQLYVQMGTGSGYTATNVYFWVRPPVTMRVTPTSIDYSTLAAYDNVSVVTATAAAIDASLSSKNALIVYTTHASGITQFRPYVLASNNSTSGYLGLSAEL